MITGKSRYPFPEDEFREIESIEHHNPEHGYDIDDFEEEFPRPKGPLSKMPSIDYAAPAFICFVIFVLTGLIYWQFPSGDKLWASKYAVFEKHEYWRLLTSIFTHADGLHLLSNTPLFLIFGWFLRAYFGRIVFPAASIIIGVITSALALTFYDPDIKLIGASGMVYGMVALWLIFYIRYDTDHPVPVRMFRAIGFSLVMLFPTVYDIATSYISHALGFIVGISIGIILLPYVKVINDNKEFSESD